MISPNGDYSNEQRDLRWNPAKQALKEWINSYENNDIVTIVLFNDEVKDIISSKKKDITWSDIEDKLDNAVEAHHGRTCICEAWRTAERYADPSKDNYFYIITDGKEEVHGDNKLLLELIRNFCDKGMQGYFLQLNIDAADFPSEVRQAILDTPCMQYVQLGADGIKPFGGFKDNEVFVTTSNMKHGGKDTSSSLNFSRKNRYPVTIAYNDPNFSIEVVDGAIDNGSIQFEVSLKPNADLATIKDAVQSDEYGIELTLRSDAVQIIKNSNLHLTVHLQPIAELNVFEGRQQLELGLSDWYDNFIIPRSEPDTLLYTITPLFNREALDKNASVEFQFKDLPENLKIFVDGKELQSSRVFKISGNTPVCVQMVPVVPCEDFDLEGKLIIVKASGLDRVLANELYENPMDFSIPVCGEVERSINPLKLTLIILTIVILIFLVFKALYNLILRPTMTGRLAIVDNNGFVTQTLGDLSGYNVAYLTGGSSREERGIINTLFTSKRLYMHVPNLNRDIKITGNTNDEIYIHKTGNISVNGLKIIAMPKKFESRTTPILKFEDNGITLITIKYIY